MFANVLKNYVIPLFVRILTVPLNFGGITFTFATMIIFSVMVSLIVFLIRFLLDG